VFGIVHEKAQRKGWAIWFGMCRAVYVMPSNRVARLGAAICGRFDMTCNVLSCLMFRAIASARLGVFLRSLGLPFESMARRSARFGLIFCIVFPFAVVAVLPVIGPRVAALLQAILSVLDRPSMPMI
jgi:hypothetical protein